MPDEDERGSEDTKKGIDGFMRAYKIITYITAVTSVLFAFLSTMLHYHGAVLNIDAEYWSNFCLSVFGSALLTLLSSILMYQHERKRTLKSFLYFTKQILKYLSKYRYSMTTKEKMQFFNGFFDLDKMQWKNEYYNLSFFFDRIRRNKKRKYIYDKIVYPIEHFNSEVISRIVLQRPDIVGDDIQLSDDTIQMIVDELQDYLLERKEEDIPVEFNEDGTPIRWTHCIKEKAKLRSEIIAELHGKFRDILYGKKREREY